ncbi:MAG TPA: ABC transporter substrate-binding protein [Firmicutes bacterium]|nr:ABC transporter substrate-binding protein [Candidatus Fermentithermobacillaceae bacterium]
MNHVFKGKKNYARAKFDGCSEGKDHIHNRGKRFIISSFRTVSIAAFLAAVIFLAGCTGSGADSPPASGGSDGDKIIKIGMVGPLTGDYATYGQSVRNGVQTAIDEINAEGGVNGFTLQLIAEDSKGESTEAANAVQKLIDQDKVTAIVGAVLSGETATVAPIAQDSGVLMVTPSSTAPGLTDTGDYIFRNVITDDVQARQLAEYVVSELGLKKFAVLYANNDYGVALKDNFTAKVEELGASVVGVESYLDGDEDFRAQLTKIGNEVDALYIAGYYTEAAKIAQQARRQGIEARLLGADGFYSGKLVELGGDAVEGALFTAGFYSGDSSENVQAFVSTYKQKYSEEPDMFAANAYDTMKIVAQALEKAGNDRAALKAEMANVKDFPGVTGTTSFDDRGEAVKEVIILKVENGKFSRAR